MRIEVMDYKKTKSEASKYISKRLPLASRVAQFNSFIENLHVEYIEFKIIEYEILASKKNVDVDNEIISIMVNTCDGRSKSVNQIPKTSKKYVTKSYIRQNRINEDELTVKVKEEILKYLKSNAKYKYRLEHSIPDIKLVNIKSIYKACWVAEFRGRNIVIDI